MGIVLTHGANSLPKIWSRPVEIGGRIYPTVKIGNLIWMAENLQWELQPIIIDGPFTSDSDTTPRAWYYNRDKSNYGLDGMYKCGLLYNGFSVPIINAELASVGNGWRVPSESDFNLLKNEVQNAQRIKAIPNSINEGFPILDWGGTNDYGFNLLPSGTANVILGFIQLNEYCSLRSSTFSGTDNLRARFSIYDSSEFLISYNVSGFGASIRLCKDA